MSDAIAFPSWDDLPAALQEQLMTTREEFEAIHARLAEREKTVPVAGDPAPDFELRRIDADGKLSDETLRLSSLRGRPVSLVFGSYT